MKLKEYLQSTDPDCMYFIGGRPAQDQQELGGKT